MKKKITTIIIAIVCIVVAALVLTQFVFKTETSHIKDVDSNTFEKAYNLLRNTDLPVTQISFDVGFSNVSYFIRSFKEKYKVTPKELRLRADDSFNV